MRPNRVYLLHPAPQIHPAITGWIAEVEALIRSVADWNDWDLHCVPYNDRNGFEVQPLFVKVLNTPGPVVLLENVQQKPRAAIQEKLGIHAVVVVRSIADPTELWALVDEARKRHIEGEPLLPRKLVVAVLIVRKLRHLNRWAGNAKSYLWHYDLAKGRGVDERFADIAEEVANDLLLHGILVNKTSKGQKKYALNPDRKREVHAIADDGGFPDKLMHVFMRDPRQESARYLRPRQTAQSFTLLSGSTKHQCISANDIICHARSVDDRLRYEVEVQFDNGNVLKEVFYKKSILLQFLEEFT